MAAPPDDPDRTSASPAGSSPADLTRHFPFLSPPDRSDDLGRLGPYRVVRLLGEGGMGFVFLGADDALGRPVALKVMRPEVAAQPTARARFLREGRAAAAVKSDHVITIYQVGEENGVPFLAMEFLEGQTLADWLREWRQANPEPARPEMILGVARHLLRGLAAAHARGLIHRDIKPANLWIESGTNRLKLLDFGLARDGPTSELTLSGAILGTAAYMAPEQARGKKVDPRTDLFSVGVVLHELLAGQSPFRRKTNNATIFAVVMDPAPPAASFGELPPGLAALIDRLLEKLPDARPASAAEVLAEVTRIEQALRGKGTTPAEGVAKPVQPPAKPQPPRVKHGPEPSEERLVAIPGGLKMLFCWVPPGSCQLGSGWDEQSAVVKQIGEIDYQFTRMPMAEFAEERGAFTTKGFWLGKYPVMQTVWRAVTSASPSYFQVGAGGAAAVKGLDVTRFPVENVSWDMCQDFLKQLNASAKGGVVFGLPHEDQWEYACRGGLGNEQPFFWGTELNGTQANINGNYPYGTATKGAYLQRPCPVEFSNRGKYPAHPWGLMHMIGNVWEWCENTYEPTHARVLRGGSWEDAGHNCRAAFRNLNLSSRRYQSFGCRLILA
jgi:serine/threonine protein kinase